jgi:hypothetical protein
LSEPSSETDMLKSSKRTYHALTAILFVLILAFLGTTLVMLPGVFDVLVPVVVLSAFVFVTLMALIYWRKFDWLTRQGIKERIESQGPAAIGDPTAIEGGFMQELDQFYKTAGTTEVLLGVVWAIQLSYGKSLGYAVAVTSKRIVGAPKPAIWHSLLSYLGPGSKASEEDRQKANQVFQEILNVKDLELAKDSMTRISWSQEGFFTGGRFVFSMTQGEIEIDTPSRQSRLWSPRVPNLFARSLLVFAPENFYNEKTGVLIRDEWIERLAKKRQKTLSRL